MVVHQKCLTQQIVAVAMLHAPPVPCCVDAMQTTTVIVTGAAHVEQEVAADGHDIQDGVDDDYNDDNDDDDNNKIRVI